jgi:hypothetical protein
MDRASIVILERTLELAAELLPQDVHVVDCMDTIRICLESPDIDVEEQFQHAVSDLSAIARKNLQFVIAARLEA